MQDNQAKPSINPDIIDKRIREALWDRNLSEVARRLSVTRAYISQVRKGHQISPNMRERLANYLNINTTV